MPPKKKTSVNIVVGTVSTRSTRRQSIVNIEIPKSNKRISKKIKQTESDDSLQSILSTDTENHPYHSAPDVETKPENETVIESTAIHSLPQQYLDVENDGSPALNEVSLKVTSDSESSVISSSSKNSGESNINVDQMSTKISASIRKAPAEKKEKKARSKRNTETEGRRVTRSKQSLVSSETECESNKELLRILDDWTDEDSEDKQDTAQIIHSESEIYLSEEAQCSEQITESSVEDRCAVIEDSISQGGEIEVAKEVVILEQQEQKEDQDDNVEPAQESNEPLSVEENSQSSGDIANTEVFEAEQAFIITENTSSSTEMCVGVVVEECVIESSEAVSETSPSDDQSMLVECITEEEVVPDVASEQSIEATNVDIQPPESVEAKMDITEDIPITEDSSQEVQYIQMEVSEQTVNIESSPIVIEENSQSIDNSDSNGINYTEQETVNDNKELESASKAEEEKEVLQHDSVNVLKDRSVSELDETSLVEGCEPLLEEDEKKVEVDVHASESEGAFSIAELERTLSEDFPDEDGHQYVNAEQETERVEEVELADPQETASMGTTLESQMESLHLMSTKSKETAVEVDQPILNVDSGSWEPYMLQESTAEGKTEMPKVKPTKSLEPKMKVSKPVKLKAQKMSKPAKDKVQKEKLTKEGKSQKKGNGKRPIDRNIKKDTSDKSATFKKEEKEKKSEDSSEDTEVRRSSRIKSISVQKKVTSGRGLVRSKSEAGLVDVNVFDNTNLSLDGSVPLSSPKVKERKSRWSKSVENMQQSPQTDVSNHSDNFNATDVKMEIEEKKLKHPSKDPVIESRLKSFVHLKENMYKTDRSTCKEAKKMICDCFLTDEEYAANEYGCGEDCLNRLLLIECGTLCPVGDRCTNKRFQKGQFAPVEVFNTEKKGLGLRAAANIPFGEFILEYVGEVLDADEFDKRAEVYSEDKNIHYYFMALRADAIIDATMKGNISRFINHSCDPNAETQKWTVNGELRIGFFSTRTILAGEEITFDYRFQRYGKEAQKCFCGTALCRGWLGDQPDSDEEEEEEEEEEVPAAVTGQPPIPSSTDKDAVVPMETTQEPKEMAAVPLTELKEVKTEVKVEETTAVPTMPRPAKKKEKKKKPRIEMFEEIDQLNEEIDMLVATGLKNQAHTLKLSRLMVRAKEPQQRAKLLRVLRKGELPCRRLFLDYHGLKLMHGYMIDAQHLVVADKNFESLRLEVLQTLAVLPIPNKTLLQDSKVLPTVELWASSKELTSPMDSDSNSPKMEEQFDKEPKTKPGDVGKNKKLDDPLGRSVEDQEEEIKFLASKLIEEWSNLKEVFRIPKKERIEQMKEHEREANKKFMQSGYGQEPEKKSERYRQIARIKERDGSQMARRPQKGEKLSAEFIRLTKVERRKLFALQHELKEEERRLKQRELWRQHEMNCMVMGTDPRFTAPFDPSKPYHCIWNPQLGQWQSYPLPSPQTSLTGMTVRPHSSLSSLANISLHSNILPQTSLSNLNVNPPANLNVLPPVSLSNLNVPQSQLPRSMPTYPYGSPIGTSIGAALLGGHPQPQRSSLSSPMAATGRPLNAQVLQQQVPTSAVSVLQHEHKPVEEDPSQVKFMGPIPPPVKLPPKWKCAKDKYGRPYYYHIKIRKSQWEPPPFPPPPPLEDDEISETESSSDTSSLSSTSSSEDGDSDNDFDGDTRLLLQVRKQMDRAAAEKQAAQQEKVAAATAAIEAIKAETSMEVTATPSPSLSDQPSLTDDVKMELASRDSPVPSTSSFVDDDMERPSIDIRLKEQFQLRDDNPPSKRRRLGLCEEIIISPRSEEEKKQLKEDLKRYKANKEKLRRQKELLLRQAKQREKEKQLREKEKRPRLSLKEKMKEMDLNSETAKKIKETFRANMASTVVMSLNAYRKSDCKEGRITNTEDFKHLARKLTHFVMLKEMKHIARIEELLCTDNVKTKAREYIRKYMSKFGEVYVKRNDSPDFKD